MYKWLTYQLCLQNIYIPVSYLILIVGLATCLYSNKKYGLCASQNSASFL